MSLVISLLIFFMPLTIANPIKVLNYKNSVKTIVKDLIDNWQSPIDYLKSRGYLPKNMGDAHEFDFDKLQKNEAEELAQAGQDQQVAEEKEENKFYHEDKSKVKETESNLVDDQNDKFMRATRSFEENDSSDLKNMFYTLFSTNDQTISDEIKTKLDVPWDMNALKLAARKEADKYFEKFCNKRNEKNFSNQTFDNAKDIDSTLEERVAQLYPSVLGSKDMHWDIKNNDLVVTSAYKKPNFLKGVAKILGNRQLMDMAKTASPLQKIEQAKM